MKRIRHLMKDGTMVIPGEGEITASTFDRRTYGVLSLIMALQVMMVFLLILIFLVVADR